MNKFWDWMFNKRYCVDAYGGTGIDRKGEGAYIPGSDRCKFESQMLIGYMAEFLLENKFLPEVIVDKVPEAMVMDLICDINLYTSEEEDET